MTFCVTFLNACWCGNSKAIALGCGQVNHSVEEW
jgi:hypothetical protein